MTNQSNIKAVDPNRPNPPAGGERPRASRVNFAQGTGSGPHENIGAGFDHLGGMGAGQRPFHADKLTPNVGGYNNPQESGRGESDANDNDNSDPRASQFQDGRTFSSRKDT